MTAPSTSISAELAAVRFLRYPPEFMRIEYAAVAIMTAATKTPITDDVTIAVIFLILPCFSA